LQTFVDAAEIQSRELRKVLWTKSNWF